MSIKEIWVDAGITKNPGGIMSIGVYIPCIGVRYQEQLGVGTCNIGEWLALQKGLELAVANGLKEVKIYSDSQIIVNRFNKRWKSQMSAHLQPYADKCWELARELDVVLVQWIPREKNIEADLLASPNRKRSYADYDDEEDELEAGFCRALLSE